MTELLLDLGESYDPARSQWRLERVEMVNWGTFHGGPHRIDLARQGYLLTGPSGSGKSSLVDAISAVLMPRKKVAFNAAATDAAGRSDRSLLSYVRGAWRHGEDAESGEVATDYLRPGATWSGIALRYATADAAAPVTLVKLFAIDRGKNTNADVKELCLILRQPVELMQFAPHLEAGLAVRAIKAAWPDAQATDRHSLFAERFCRIMGVPADTMALLHKAQSAKSLESLDALFRGFMLPRPKTFEIADQAAAQFRELSDAHARVVQARRQVEQLEPLPALVSANKQATEQVRRVERLVESVEPYRDKRKRALAEEELAALTVKLELAESAEAQARRAADEAQEQYLAARAAYERQGGQALLRLENAVERARERLAVVGRSRDELSRDLARVGIDLPGSAEELAELKAAGRGDDQAGAADQLQRHSEAAVAARDAILAELKETRAELEAVAQSRSNLPVAQLQARELLARVSGVPLAQLPFAGELMEVPEQHSDWRGAFERVLRPLAMSLLVPAKHGQAITAAADAHNLRTRLVFRIVPADAPRVERPVMPDSLALRVAVKDGPLAGWLSATLTRRYDYACVGDPAELAPVERGVTRAGQVKHGRDHHEKDDRAEVGDRRRWIMGFDNEARLDRLQAAIRDLRGRAATAEQAVLKAIAERDQAVRRADALDRLAGRAWEDIDVEGATRLEQSATDELESYRVADPDLRRAEHRQDTAKKAAALAEASCQREHDQCVKMRDGIERIRSLLDELVPAGAGDGAGGGAGGGA
ncbi:MAG: AAA family ATPase, partial [Bifidobacteriaceae bacterium]|nr:AAA family ATPase [Bifidobacteriaceae bacterium]